MRVAARKDARAAWRAVGLLNAQIGENFGFGFIDCQKVVADGAILRNGVAVFGGMAAVVAAETTRVFHVADVVGMRSPGDFHKRKNILVVERDEFLAGLIDQRGFLGEHGRILRAIKGLKLLGDLDAGLFLTGEIAVQEYESLFVNPRQIGADCAARHCLINGFACGYECVRGAVVAVDAIHHSAVAFGNAATGRERTELCKRTVCVLPLDPWNCGAG